MNWNITQLEIAKQSEDFTDLVIKAHWEVSKEGVRYYDVCTLPLPEGDYIPLDELTIEQVLDWIWANGVDKYKAEQKVEEKIEKLNNPPTYTYQFQDTDGVVVEPSEAPVEAPAEEVTEEVAEEVAEEAVAEVVEDEVSSDEE